MFVPKGFSLLFVPFIGFGIGWYIDRTETERLTLFRDKSALYGRQLKEEQPSRPQQTPKLTKIHIYNSAQIPRPTSTFNKPVDNESQHFFSYFQNINN